MLLLVSPPPSQPNPTQNSNLGQRHLFGTGHGAGRARPPRQSCAHVAVHGAAGTFAAPAAAGTESPPGVHSFARPDPHPRGDAHQKAHEVLEHEHRVVGTPALALEQAVGAVVRNLPTLPVVLLVKVTGDYNGGRHRVEYRENPDSDHQLLQFVRFGATLFDDAADPEQRHKSGQKKHCPDEQINHQRSQNKAA